VSASLVTGMIADTMSSQVVPSPLWHSGLDWVHLSVKNQVSFIVESQLSWCRLPISAHFGHKTKRQD
jgi:hypothetical protein